MYRTFSFIEPCVVGYIHISFFFLLHQSKSNQIVLKLGSNISATTQCPLLIFMHAISLYCNVCNDCLIIKTDWLFNHMIVEELKNLTMRILSARYYWQSCFKWSTLLGFAVFIWLDSPPCALCDEISC